MSFSCSDKNIEVILGFSLSLIPCIQSCSKSYQLDFKITSKM